MSMLISAAIWAAESVLLVILFFAMLLSAVIMPFDKKRALAHAQCFWWCDAAVKLNPYWKLVVEGLENIDPRRTYVVVVNHQSLADIAVLYKTRMQFKWVAKASLFRVPVLGWNMSLARHIKLTRGKFSSIKKVYREAAGWLRNDVSVLFFPEGTRSDTNEIKEFQNGAFKLAIKEKRPVLPISIEGTRDVIPKGSWVFNNKVSSRIRVFPPVETDTFQPGDFARLRDTVRATLGGFAS